MIFRIISQSLPSLVNLPLIKLQKHCFNTYTKGTLICVTFQSLPHSEHWVDVCNYISPDMSYYNCI